MPDLTPDTAEREVKARVTSKPEVERGITRCWQRQGFHVYMAGPCFDTLKQARAYRDSLDAEGITWRPQGP